MQHSQEDTGSAGPATAVQITETPDTHGAYPRLGVDQLASLEAAGRRRPTTVGDLLFREGDRTTDFFVVLYGLVASVDGYGTARERQISLHGERRFLGELGLLSGQTAFTRWWCGNLARSSRSHWTGCVGWWRPILAWGT